MRDEGGKRPQRFTEKALRGFSPVSTDETIRQSRGGEVLQIPPTTRRGAPQRGEAVPPGTKKLDSREWTSERMRIGGWNAPPGAAERDAEEARTTSQSPVNHMSREDHHKYASDALEASSMSD